MKKREDVGIKHFDDSKALWNIITLWMIRTMILTITMQIEVIKYW